MVEESMNNARWNSLLGGLGWARKGVYEVPGISTQPNFVFHTREIKWKVSDGAQTHTQTWTTPIRDRYVCVCVCVEIGWTHSRQSLPSCWPTNHRPPATLTPVYPFTSQLFFFEKLSLFYSPRYGSVDMNMRIRMCMCLCVPRRSSFIRPSGSQPAKRRRRVCQSFSRTLITSYVLFILWPSCTRTRTKDKTWENEQKFS